MKLYRFLGKALNISGELAQEGVVAFDAVIKEGVEYHTERRVEIIHRDMKSLQAHIDEKFRAQSVELDIKIATVEVNMLEKHYAQLRWMVLLWILQLGAISVIVGLLLKK